MIIGGDWGTTNLRLFRFAGDGTVLDVREAPRGVMQEPAQGFEAVLRDVAGDWLRPGAAVILSGMVGSRQGWIEAPYLPCPSGTADLAGALTKAPCQDLRVFIAPGLKSVRPDGVVDVMRGEETEIYGVIDQLGSHGGLVISPGTHSKWAWLADGRIAGFSTYMTGELYAVLKTHSILGRLMQSGPHDAGAFTAGAERALSSPDPLGLLFSVRTAGLFGQIPPAGLSSYLSGLLIGAEAAAGAAAHGTGPITVIASDVVGGFYAEALARAGFAPVRIIDSQAAAPRGLWRIAVAAGLLQKES